MAAKGLIMNAGATSALIFLLLSGISCAAEDSNGYYIKHKQTIEQTVISQGYSSIYQTTQNRNLELNSYIHGSGTLNLGTITSSSKTKLKYFPQDKNALVYTTPVHGYESEISFFEQNEMVYAPMTVAYGTGYYAKNPIVYNSKLKEKTEGKSYQQGVSMNHKIDYASAFQKDIRVDLQCKDAINYTDPPVYGFGLSRMEIDEEVMSGVVHIGKLMTDGEYGWKKPIIEIDENYIGDIKLTNKMEVITTKTPEKLGKDWLSCCISGYCNIDEHDKIWDEKKVFDCGSC